MTPEAEVLVIDEITDDMEHSPFGQRWGQQVIEVTPQHLQSLQAGQLLALDVQGEYVVYLRKAQIEKEVSHG